MGLFPSIGEHRGFLSITISTVFIFLANYISLSMVIIMADIVVKKIDRSGRILIPAKWRKNLGELVILVREDDNSIRILPLRNFSLTDLFDSIEISASIEEWRDVKKLKRRIVNEVFGL